MKREALPDLNRRIAQRVRSLRAENRLSLDAIAQKSGVSRSMISLIERGQASPTAVILEKLAGALGQTLAALFEPSEGQKNKTPHPVARLRDQVQWQDPASGYWRRNVSPPGVSQPMQIVEVHFPAGQRVAFDISPRENRVYQQIWVLEGAIKITVGKECHELRTGDCLAMQLDQPTMFHNATRKLARYAVVLATETTRRR